LRVDGSNIRLGNELSVIVLVDTCFTLGVDLAIVVVVDAGTCSHDFVVGVVCTCISTVEFKLHGIMLPFLSKIIQRWFGGVVGRDNVLEDRENGRRGRLDVLICVVILVVLEKLFEQRSGRILMTDDVVEGLNNGFVMVSETMRVGVRWRHSESPIFVHLRVFTGEDGFSDRWRDPVWGMLEEESNWELAIASVGYDGPGREVVTIHPGDEVGVEFRRNEVSVHCLVLAIFFAVIL
jgi:hypothetical protein